ncbi:MAG: D-sedoheptulose 7-phosphate isomerase [Elusimicrobiota bacterium]|nr:D-sedoheptulose 7-phosphate isomerase [Elusimicrobiota bacterium]
MSAKLDQCSKLIRESIKVKERILQNKEILTKIDKIAHIIIQRYKKGSKVVVFGNGGSAADAQHLSTELVCRFEKERESINAVALTTNTSLLTAIGNDYGFEKVFSRQVESIVNRGDVVIGISTSGNSPNVLLGIKQAKKQKAITVGLTGKAGGKLKNIVDYCVCVPSENTARIQESHVLITHIICQLIEEELFK